jgi:peptide chain release factor 2
MLRALFRSDLLQLLSIEESAHAVPWNEGTFKTCFQAGYGGWVVEQGKEIVGFIIVSMRMEECHILNLCVSRDYQHQGFGRQLLACALNHAKQNHAKQQGIGIVYLEVRRSNTRAISLYRMDIQSGSGGTEAQDWSDMLLRMYLRWGERHGFKTELIEVSPAEIAGIKSATVKFEGPYAYGWLRTESGVHRLVRKSPFDSNNKRHTSFASVFISPEIDDNIVIEINPADLRIDTYRASGAGGQHVNRTDSAIRITHIPTNIVVQCQADRSQHKNRAQAMKQLRAKLYELEIQKQADKQAVLEAGKKEITWGSQIRSYVLDMSRIKDLRTGVEVGNTQAVLDGDLDKFIEASLLSGL